MKLDLLDRRVLLGDGNIARYSSFLVWSTVKNESQPLVFLLAPGEG